MLTRRQVLKAIKRTASVATASLLLDALVEGIPSTTVAKGAEPAESSDWLASFPIGVFEDANVTDGDQTKFETMVNDLKSRGLGGVLFTNGAAERDTALLSVSDRLDFDVYLAPTWELDRDWWTDKVPATLDAAKRAIGPIVKRLAPYHSLKGYSLIDEPQLSRLQKVSLATEAFHQLDPSRPVMPTLVGIDRTTLIFASAKPDVMLVDVYPAARINPVGNFSMGGFGYPDLDFVSYVRAVTVGKPPETPLWIILQTHSYDSGDRFALREPTRAEVRAEHWLAIGEGATGIFWFIYSSQPGWTGLKDNPTLYQEVTDLARRVAVLRDTLRPARRGDDRFIVSGSGPANISTLASQDGKRQFAVVVNRNCTRDQMLSITAPNLHGQLRDLETMQTYSFGSPISFRPGDGRVFELIAPGAVGASCWSR